MIDLQFSNRTEGLLRALARDMADFRFRAPGGAWEPIHLVLPNPSVKQFVLRWLARSYGVQVHVRTNYLEGFWRRFLPGGGDGLRLLDRSALQGQLLALLQDPEILRRPELGPVAIYLSGSARDLKGHQLAEELARIFEAYLLTRPDWVGAWAKGAAVAPGVPGGLEGWQRALWTLLFRNLKAAPEPWLTLPELVRDPRFDRMAFPGEVFIFGLGHVARAHLEAFQRLGQLRTVHLYALSPSREAWDTFPEQLRRPQEGDDPFGLEDPGSLGGLALRRWGRPVREHVRLLSELADWNVHEAFEEPEGASLLAALQRDLLQVSGASTELAGAAADGSLAVHACPSPRREAEVVANLIWDRVLEGGASFSDIAVMIPEGKKAEYLDPLRLAFAGSRQIPWALADEGPAALRQLAEAAGLLMKLGLTDLNRAEVLRVMEHPALRRAWEDLPLERLPDLCDRCAIIARLDAGETEGTSLAGGLWTWDRGLQRAALGRFAGEAGRLPEGAGDPPGELPGAHLAPEEADLLHMLLALLRDARTLRSLRQAPSEWTGSLLAFLQAYLAPGRVADDEAWVRAMDALGRAVGRLEGLEVAGLPPPELGLREVAAFLEEAFQRLLSENLGQLGHGVVVASHASLRGIPFDTVLMMGMGEGVFPGRDTASALDLRAQRRRAGDLSRSDQDRTLFLEALLSARNRLLFTYVHRDSLSGETREPSPLLLDLRDVLLPALGEAGWKALACAHPIHRHDLGYFSDLGSGAGLPTNHHPEARREAEALALGRALRSAAGGRTALPLDLRTWGLKDAVLRDLEDRVRSLGPLEGPLEPRSDVRIRVADLRRWLECPLQGGARLRLGLQGEADDDPALVDAEPLETPFLLQRSLKRRVFWQVQAGGDLHTAVTAELQAAREAGRAPVGPLKDGELGELTRVVEAWTSLAPDLGLAQVVRFGPDRAGQPTPLQVVPEASLLLELDLGDRPLRVLLEGATEPLAGGDTILLSEREPPKAGKTPEVKDRRDLLRAWLDQLMLAAAGRKEGPHAVRVLGAHAKAAGAWRVILPPVDQAGAKAQLEAWVREALQDTSWRSLPIEGVLESLEEGNLEPDALAVWLEQQQGEGERSSFSAIHGPLPRLAFHAPDPDWLERSRARLGGFPGWVCGAEVQA